MFKQITDLNGDEWYLIASLGIFLIFFITVAIMLFRMQREETEYIKSIPIDEQDGSHPQTDN